MQHHITLIAFFLLFPLTLFSQSGSGNPGTQAPYVLDFRVMAWSGSVWDLYRDPQEVEFFTVGSHRPSEWFKYSGPGPVPIPLYKKGETVTGEDGVEYPRPVAFLQPDSPGKWLFLLFRDKDAEGNLMYRSLPVKDESLDLKEGYLIINLSDLELAVSMNGELMQIEAKGRKHFTPQPFEDNTVNVKIAANQTGQWKLMKTNTFVMPKTGLTTIFVTKQGRRLWIRRFADQQPE